MDGLEKCILTENGGPVEQQRRRRDSCREEQKEPVRSDELSPSDGAVPMQL